MQIRTTRAIRKNESGNVLFLILIAVALFAALSYAVTQSSRSGGGDAANETNLVNSASVTQYPAGVRTAIIRMMVSGGVDVDSLSFDPPSAFSGLTTPAANVFHPSGGGASHGLGPADIMTDNAQHAWHFNADFEVNDIGTSVATDPDGNDVIAFLAHISNSICKKINDQLGITSGDADNIPAVAGLAAEYDNDLEEGEAIPNEVMTLGDAAATGDELSGQPFGCFRDTVSGDNVYYHVLIER